MSKPISLAWVNYSAPNIGKYERMINPSTLPKDQKQRLWQGIKKTDPALADMMVNDKNIAVIKRVFEAEIVFTQRQINGFIGTVNPE
jgi:hypothetical protein